MSKSKETWNKREREKKREKNRIAKEEKKKERKESGGTGKNFDDMIAYVDENGNFTSTPPDPLKRNIINAEDIQVSVPKQEDMDPADLIRTGVVSFFNESKGFGFIRDTETQESVFVHINSLSEPIKENNMVLFEVEMNPKGATAVNVKLKK